MYLYFVHVQLLAFMSLNRKCWEINNFGKYSFFNAQDFCCRINALNFYTNISFTWSKCLLSKEKVGKEYLKNVDK